MDRDPVIERRDQIARAAARLTAAATALFALAGLTVLGLATGKALETAVVRAGLVAVGLLVVLPIPGAWMLARAMPVAVPVTAPKDEENR